MVAVQNLSLAQGESAYTAQEAECVEQRHIQQIRHTVLYCNYDTVLLYNFMNVILLFITACSVKQHDVAADLSFVF